MEGVEPLASPDDCLLAEEIAKADPKVQEQLKLRGVTDVSLVACDPWSGQNLCQHWHHCPSYVLYADVSGTVVDVGGHDNVLHICCTGLLNEGDNWGFFS